MSVIDRGRERVAVTKKCCFAVRSEERRVSLEPLRRAFVEQREEAGLAVVGRM